MRFTPAVSLCCLLVSVAANAGQPAPSVEEIYVVRSLRLSRDAASPFCATDRTGFPNARTEDHYQFQSIAIDTESGIVTDPNVRTVGTARACFGPTDDPALFNFYGEGTLGNVSFRGRGECRTAKRDYPEPGANISRCFLDIADLPSGYVGGHLTSNTVSSKQSVGLTSDPPGYVQPSIATIRLWRHRQPN
jgi:hypothetical protein